MSFPYYKQPDAMDCGPTCLRMVAKHYGRNFKVQTLRKLKFALMLLFGMMGSNVSAQLDTSAKYNIGDAAPPLRVREWIKGNPVKSFEKGRVYVVEFWATWCRPCIASMPDLSRLARKYRHKVTFIAIDVYESQGYKPMPLAKIKAFVDSMGRRMDFPIAAEDTNNTIHDWFKGFDWEGIPASFVIDRQGRVAWIDQPYHLDTVLRKVADNTWDIKKALAERIFDDSWEKSDLEVNEKLRRFLGIYDHLEDMGSPDSTLLAVDEMIKKQPNLTYAPWVACYTFYALLMNNPHAAYEYGKKAMVTPTYDYPAWDRIIGDIKDASLKINIPQEIYQLGADCYQAKINAITYPQLYDMARLFRNMAAWYILAGDKAKALKAQKKAIKLYRRNK